MSDLTKTRIVFWVLIGVMIFITVFAGGCGTIGDLRYVPPGETPPAGSIPILDAVAAASEGGIGDWVQTLAGFVGCGGLVALGRKFLKDRAKTRKIREQDTALREIVAGVEEAADCDSPLKRTLGLHQKTESTRRIVANVKVDNAKIPDKN